MTMPALAIPAATSQYSSRLPLRNPDVVTRLQAGCQQDVGDPVGTVVEFRIGLGAVAVDYRGRAGCGDSELAYAVGDVEICASGKDCHITSQLWPGD